MTELHALLIPVGEDVYALDAASVREVVGEPVATRVPMTPPWMLGIFNLRGEVVPLFDTAAMIGIGRTPSVSFVAVVTTSGGPAGLVVSGLPKVAVLTEQAGPSDLRATRGLYLIDDGVAVLIDVEAMLVAQHGDSSIDVRGLAS